MRNLAPASFIIVSMRCRLQHGFDRCSSRWLFTAGDGDVHDISTNPARSRSPSSTRGPMLRSRLNVRETNRQQLMRRAYPAAEDAKRNGRVENYRQTCSRPRINTTGRNDFAVNTMYSSVVFRDISAICPSPTTPLDFISDVARACVTRGSFNPRRVLTLLFPRLHCRTFLTARNDPETLHNAGGPPRCVAARTLIIILYVITA